MTGCLCQVISIVFLFVETDGKKGQLISRSQYDAFPKPIRRQHEAKVKAA